MRLPIAGIELIHGSSESERAVKDHQTFVIFREAEFLFGTHHTVGLHTAQFGFLDFEIPFFRAEDRADSSDRNNVSGVAVGCPANDLDGFSTDIDFADGHVV